GAGDDLARTFHLSYRSDLSPPRAEPASAGAGLGLAIARGLIQAHRGRIWAERSQLGGVSIQIRLPLNA
ncbi:MAG: ATP-binding protein, partial [Chloroflexota bacterium]